MKYEVAVEGSFLREIFVEANNPKEAEKRAVEELDKEIGLSKEDYSVSSCVTIPEAVWLLS